MTPEQTYLSSLFVSVASLKAQLTVVLANQARILARLEEVGEGQVLTDMENQILDLTEEYIQQDMVQIRNISGKLGQPSGELVNDSIPFIPKIKLPPSGDSSNSL